MDKIYKIYNAMKKPTQDRTIRMQKIVDNVAQKVKKQPVDVPQFLMILRYGDNLFKILAASSPLPDVPQFQSSICPSYTWATSIAWEIEE